MNKLLVVSLVLIGSVAWGCKSGFIPTETDGVCVEHDSTPVVTNLAWVSDEKPSRHPEPAYQRGEVKIIDAPSTRDQDEKADQAKREADAEGRKAAGIK